jgi:hypothetical protein
MTLVNFTTNLQCLNLFYDRETEIFVYITSTDMRFIIESTKLIVTITLNTKTLNKNKLGEADKPDFRVIVTSKIVPG